MGFLDIGQIVYSFGKVRSVTEVRVGWHQADTGIRLSRASSGPSGLGDLMYKDL